MICITKEILLKNIKSEDYEIVEDMEDSIYKINIICDEIKPSNEHKSPYRIVEIYKYLHTLYVYCSSYDADTWLYLEKYNHLPTQEHVTPKQLNHVHVLNKFEAIFFHYKNIVDVNDEINLSFFQNTSNSLASFEKKATHYSTIFMYLLSSYSEYYKLSNLKMDIEDFLNKFDEEVQHETKNEKYKT